MSEEHEPDLVTELPADAPNPLEETDLLESVGTDTRELLSLLGGGVVLVSTLRSLRKGQLRAIPKGAVAALLLRYGLRKRRSSDAETFEPSYDEVESGTDGKDVSDAAHAAAEREDSGRESQIDASGEIDDSAQLGEEGETGSRVEFTDDADEAEPRTKPEHVGDEADPRRDADDDSVEIDVSDTAMAEETSEATGPDPEQSMPSQTDATEPEETPEEDASDKQFEPDEGESRPGDDGEE